MVLKIAVTHERANGRTYTEPQIALPRELEPAQRQELAREATRELLGDRFAYTLAVHTPLAKDNIEQPHMHLMFSERVVDSNMLRSMVGGEKNTPFLFRRGDVLLAPTTGVVVGKLSAAWPQKAAAASRGTNCTVPQAAMLSIIIAE